MLHTLETLENTSPRIRGIVERIHGDAGIVRDGTGRDYFFISQGCKWGPQAFYALEKGMSVTFNEIIPFNERAIGKNGLAWNIAIDTPRGVDDLVPKTEAKINKMLDPDDTKKTL